MSYLSHTSYVVFAGTKAELKQTAAWAVTDTPDHPLAGALEYSVDAKKITHHLSHQDWVLTIRHHGEQTLYMYAANVETILPLSDLTSNEREELLLTSRKFGDRPTYVIGSVSHRHGTTTPQSLHDITPLHINGVIAA